MEGKGMFADGDREGDDGRVRDGSGDAMCHYGAAARKACWLCKLENGIYTILEIGRRVRSLPSNARSHSDYHPNKQISFGASSPVSMKGINMCNGRMQFDQSVMTTFSTSSHPSLTLHATSRK